MAFQIPRNISISTPGASTSVGLTHARIRHREPERVSQFLDNNQVVKCQRYKLMSSVSDIN